MKQFATSLIWGEYTEGKLLEMFRYAEDGTFYSVIGENHEFSSGTVIGFIHPLELSETERNCGKSNWNILRLSSRSYKWNVQCL